MKMMNPVAPMWNVKFLPATIDGLADRFNLLFKEFMETNLSFCWMSFYNKMVKTETNTFD